MCACARVCAGRWWITLIVLCPSPWAFLPQEKAGELCLPGKEAPPHALQNTYFIIKCENDP